jgi:hypothetical protein
MTDSIPMIDTILRPRDKAKWEKLDDDECEEVQLHRKFWIQGEYNKLFNVEEEAAEDNEGAAKVIEDFAEIAKRAAEAIEGITGSSKPPQRTMTMTALNVMSSMLGFRILDPGRS